MITRTAASLVPAWLASSQLPELGLPLADNCSGQLCVIGTAAESGGETIFQRLHEVRREIRAGGTTAGALAGYSQ